MTSSILASVVFLKIHDFARRPASEQARLRAQLEAVVAVTTADLVLASRIVLDRPTWMIALLAGMTIGLVLMTWGDAMERSIRYKLRHHELTRDRTLW